MTSHPDPRPGSTLPLPVAAVADALRDVRIPWVIAGGWAIDLALGRVTRAHGDVDVAVFRADQAALRAALAGWRFDAIAAGGRAPWPAEAWLALPVHKVRGRPSDGEQGPEVEFLLNERDGADWMYRRDPAVRLPLARAIRAAPSGVPVLAPEIVLLYKSKAPRPADEHDFAIARELLDGNARRWLGAALSRHDLRHPWLARLDGGG